jgi:glycosyltransferase involved in cell wall biosynthesis
MKFSVVIPLYNGAELIEKTLDSVLAQTHKDYEVVLVNDGSPDNVGEVVKRYIANHPEASFKYIEQENKGLGGARNTAIRHASGEIIAILDQDDIWYPEKLERVSNIFDENPEVDVVCHYFYIRRNGKLGELWRTGPLEEEMHRKMLFEGNRFATLTTCFKRSIIDKIGYFSEDVENLHFVEDYDLWMRMALADCKFYFIPEVLAEYIQHDGNYSSNSVDRMVKSESFVVHTHYNMLKNKRRLDWYRLRRRKAAMYYWAAHNLFFGGCSLPGAARYLMLVVVTDPLYILNFPKKIFRRLLRGLSLKGVRP